MKVSQQREQERHDELRRRSHVIRREADQTNDLTLSQHRTAQQLALIRKYQDGLFHNRVTSLSPRQTGHRGAFSTVAAAQMKMATGLKGMHPGGLLTERQVSHVRDHQARKNREKEKKDALKKELEIQMQEKIFRRERERLYMDEKAMATSKGLIKGMGVNIAHTLPSEY